MFIRLVLWFEGVEGNRQTVGQISECCITLDGWVEPSPTQVCFVWTFVPELFREICVYRTHVHRADCCHVILHHITSRVCASYDAVFSADRAGNVAVTLDLSDQC